LLTRSDQVVAPERQALRRVLQRLAPHAAVIETSHEALECRNVDGHARTLERLAGVPVAAFCGLGNPDAFHRSLTGLGLDVRAWRAFPDHHGYGPADVADLEAWAGGLDPATVLITTQKDLVKLRVRRLGGRPLWCLRVRLRIDAGQETLHELLDGMVRPGLSGSWTGSIPGVPTSNDVIPGLEGEAA
jgi:tetraacyldisaccharide 4'-kinase